MNFKIQMIVLFLLCGTVYPQQKSNFNINKQLKYCAAQASKTLANIPNDGKLPRTILLNEKSWKYVEYGDWTSGFWPGILWKLFELTNDKKWMTSAEQFTHCLKPLSVTKANDHDLGFQIFNSFGNGYRLTKNEDYKRVILATADTLATLYNPKAGTILSWPHNNYGGHNTIIDNMMNLELLFWASKNGGNKSLYDIAVRHAETTMENHFRPDGSSYHVVVYDFETGKRIKAVTAQGFADDSMGQGDKHGRFTDLQWFTEKQKTRSS